MNETSEARAPEDTMSNLSHSDGIAAARTRIVLEANDAAVVELVARPRDDRWFRRGRVLR